MAFGSSDANGNPVGHNLVKPTSVDYPTSQLFSLAFPDQGVKREFFQVGQPARLGGHSPEPPPQGGGLVRKIFLSPSRGFKISHSETLTSYFLWFV